MQQLPDVVGVLGVPMVASPGHAVGPGLWSLQHQAALNSLQHFQWLGTCQPQSSLHKLWVSVKRWSGQNSRIIQRHQEEAPGKSYLFHRILFLTPKSMRPKHPNRFLCKACLELRVTVSEGRQYYYGWWTRMRVRGRVTHVRYWLTFSAGCLKRPSNSSRAHYRQS